MIRVFHIIIFLIMYCLLSVESFSQPPLNYVWKKVHISSDSLRPNWISFIDSTTGYFCASIKQNSPDQIYFPHYVYKTIFFQTVNGGMDWSIMQDTLFNQPYLLNGTVFTHSPFRPYFFPSLNDNYIYMPIFDTSVKIIDTIYAKGDTLINTSRNWFARRNNGGVWRVDKKDPWGNSPNSYNILCYALGGKDLLFYCDTGSLRNRIVRSYDGGQSIQYLSSDEFFARVLRPDTVGDNKDAEAQFFIEASDPLHWTVIINRGRGVLDTTTEYKLFPRGLRTLVTSNAGKSWSLHSTIITNEDDIPLQGNMQYIKGTPHLYYFSGWSHIAEGFLDPDWNLQKDPPELSYYNLARPMLGINVCYSSDYGKTWKIDTTFGQRRRGFEAVQKDELWFTLPKKETGRDDDPAYILARTTDGGVSYAFDTTTLTHFEQKLDGRIITFSDPRHGWIVATGDNHKDLYILRYDANEQPKSVEDELFKGYYGVHYTLYPNPARETATLDLYKYFMMEDLKAYNILGAEVPLRYHIEGSKVELDVRDLPIGHYTLRVKHNWGISVIPLVVMR